MLRRFRPALTPTLVALPSLILLIVLGNWQMSRLEWKRDLIATIDARLAAPPMDLPTSGIDPETLNYRSVRVSGVFHHDKEIHLIAHTKMGELGYHVITPLERTGGDFVLINRGWVPTPGRDPLTRSEGQVAGSLEVNGIVRKPWAQRQFVPDNDPKKNVWFYGDLTGMAAHLGITAAPVFVEADGAKNPGDWPQGGQTRVEFINNHLQYAFTWYGLAIALLAVYLAYHRKEQRL